MNFQPPTKRAMGQCTCPPDVKNQFGHLPECPSLHPLQQTHHEYRAPERMTAEAVRSACVRGDAEVLGSEALRARAEEERLTAALLERDRRIALLEEQAHYREDAIAVARRDAMYEVACEGIARGRGVDAYLHDVKDANAPKE